MGHIDHGKTTLLDYIRKTKVVEKEKGAITQHIGAYEVKLKEKRITFLDTPGHEAFSKMRLRGAKVADIAILVIASDEGVKPQTIEAYKILEQTKIPFIVALNKIDKPRANPEQVKAQLAESKAPSVNISAKTGEGVEELLDLILLMAEMENLKGDFKQNASGVVIESHLDPKRGITAILLIQNGIMKKGMCAVSGDAIASVKIFEDFQGKNLEEATFSSPVRIAGFNKLPQVGAEFKTFESKKEIEIIPAKIEPVRIQTAEFESLPNKIIIPIIIKSDVSGSVEAIEKEISKLNNQEVSINILKMGIGNIVEEDVKFACAGKAIILSFNVNTDASIKNLAERLNVVIQNCEIIYEMREWLEKEIEKRKKQIIAEKIIGRAKILKLFSKTKNKQVIGGEVLEGKIVVYNSYIKIKREDSELGEGKIIKLQQNKAPAKEVNQGQQFGVMIESKVEAAVGDTIEILEKIL
jgi:translation initiation factor IF-2